MYNNYTYYYIAGGSYIFITMIVEYTIAIASYNYQCIRYVLSIVSHLLATQYVYMARL